MQPRRPHRRHRQELCRTAIAAVQSAHRGTFDAADVHHDQPLYPVIKLLVVAASTAKVVTPPAGGRPGATLPDFEVRRPSVRASQDMQTVLIARQAKLRERLRSREGTLLLQREVCRLASMAKSSGKRHPARNNPSHHSLITQYILSNSPFRC